MDKHAPVEDRDSVWGQGRCFGNIQMIRLQGENTDTFAGAEEDSWSESQFNTKPQMAKLVNKFHLEKKTKTPYYVFRWLVFLNPIIMRVCT